MLTGLIDPTLVVNGPPASSKEELLAGLCAFLAERRKIADPEGAAAALIRREGLITTAVRRGLAFPHAFTPGAPALVLLVALYPGGVDFGSLDGHPVHAVFLLLGPPEHQDHHLRVMARLSTMTARPEFLAALLESESPESAARLLAEEARRSELGSGG